MRDELKEQIAEVIGQAAGVASACWDQLDKAGEFDTTRAAKAVDEAVMLVCDLIDMGPGVYLTTVEWEEVTEELRSLARRLRSVKAQKAKLEQALARVRVICANSIDGKVVSQLVMDEIS